MHTFTRSSLFNNQLKKMPIFQQLIKRYEKTKPFKNKKIAIAHVLVPNTLPLIYSVIIGGGQATITNCCPPTLDDATIDLLHKAGCDVNLEFIDASNYDYAIDCTGHFVNYPPKYGIVEVTQTGIHRYKQKGHQITIINADDSKSKLIETFIGNPKAVLRGIRVFIEEPKVYLKNKTTVIVGFGKIGRGLARLFQQYCKILVCDIDQNVLNKASNLNFNTLLITDNKKANSRNIHKADIIITCTGHENVITDYFIKDIININNKLFLNIGASDEFGSDYTADDVFMSKDKPFNFNLIPPTENKYIDPILAAQVEGLRFIISEKLKPEIYPLPMDIDNEMVQNFSRFQNEDISDINKYF